MKIRNSLNRERIVLCASFASLAAAGAACASVAIATVPVGNAGNPADPATGFGSVGYSYNIGKYDVTAGQYTAFLNAVAATDPYGLYTANMSSALLGNESCGITQTGSPGSYAYTTARDPNYPVNNVSWGDAARFCNWLTNGQPTGAEGSGTTETGSYTLNGATSNAVMIAVTRNANAIYVIPTQNEWYKAAYYNPAGNSYYLYPMRSNTFPSNTLSATGTDNANYLNVNSVPQYTDPANYLTVVGALANSPSPYGTYDQGGDVYQWNESVYGGSYRGLLGGSFFSAAQYLQSGFETYNANTPGAISDYNGFRVSQVPEPASAGIVCLGSAGILVRRRRGTEIMSPI